MTPDEARRITHTAGRITMRARLAISAALAALLAVAAIAPAGAKEFGTVWVDDVAYRTFATPARVDPGTGTDPIISFTNFEQGGVAQFAPGKGSHGGRWAVTLATWVDPADARLVTDYDQILELASGEDPQITLVRAPAEDFRCPILPNG
jgi:hypothetical protein